MKDLIASTRSFIQIARTHFRNYFSAFGGKFLNKEFRQSLLGKVLTRPAR
jgi:hypothetical protein